MDTGKEKLEQTLAKSDLVLPETSHQGQELIREELGMLTTEFDGFSQDCEDLQDNLGIISLMDCWVFFFSHIF
mgnify:CR=1 FL=1